MTIDGTPVLGFLLSAYESSKGVHDKIGFVLEGSSGSSKTWSIMQFLLIYSQSHSRKRITCAKSTQVSLRASIWRDFSEDILTGYGVHYEANLTALQLFHNANVFRFAGADNPKKLHGNRQDVFWFNEAMEMKHESFKQLNMRTNELWFLDYNPSAGEHWIYDSLLKGMEQWGRGMRKVRETVDEDSGKTITEAVYYLHSTFRDNTMLPGGQRAEIMGYEPTEKNIENGTADEWHWLVYGLGQRAAREGAVYKNWAFHAKAPEGLGEPACWWIDFGYINDPTACGRLWKHKGELWVEEAFYETGLVNAIPEGSASKDVPNIAGRLREHGATPKTLIACDIAEQKSCAELRYADFAAYPVAKGRINAEIARLSKWRINVIGSPNIKSEVRQYEWARDPITGKCLNVPIDKHNHHLDGIRYAVKFAEELGLI